jgi:hypothetical protein
MNFKDNFNRLFIRVRIDFVKLLLNECPYMFAMFITHVGLRNDQKYKCDTVNSEYTLANSK